jgi:acyl dehydratase
MDAGMPFLRPISDRYFEDYIEGDVHRFGTIAVEADEIVAFANRFDPQMLHTDSEAAKSGPFGGLIASTSLTQRSSSPPGEPRLAILVR